MPKIWNYNNNDGWTIISEENSIQSLEIGKFTGNIYKEEFGFDKHKNEKLAPYRDGYIFLEILPTDNTKLCQGFYEILQFQKKSGPLS